MNIFSSVSLIFLCIVTGCDNYNHIDYSSFNIDPKIITSQDQQGFIITDTYSPFTIPSDFANLKNASQSLINSNWLSNPHYLEDIYHLIYQFNQTHIDDSTIFVQSLYNSALIYKKNMIEVNMLKRQLQDDVNNKLNYYQQEIALINTRLSIMKMTEEQHIENIAMIKNTIKEKQQYYTKLRRELKEELHAIQLNNDLIFILISDIKFKYNAHNTINCSTYLGDYKKLNLVSPYACIYYNHDELITKVPVNNQQQINVIFEHYVPKLWHTMVELNGHFEPSYGKQVFNSYLQKDLVIANNNLAEKRLMSTKPRPYDAIGLEIKRLMKLNFEMNTNINKALLDDNNHINISTPTFYSKLAPLFSNGKIRDPIINFSLLCKNNSLIEKFTQKYAVKILNEYPKSLTFQIEKNGTFTLPKIRAKHYKIVLNVNENYSVIYNGRRVLTPPTDFTQASPNTTTVQYNLNRLINQQLFEKWIDS
ncbi:hypothetical protein AYY19_04405 [Photobacterium aquimaris]|uniref:Uncharacterized protein n=1 Tax=Photobacterium aquimaris TaxID=512643 RepID=A0A2T3IGK7_9GAMM|nr:MULTISPECIES: hypothetical protein [Photobacterium]OBU16405.1 hypothetical protein AYY19_04405 [Photobacterium aquimaris]OBU21482.1 hypothetical protein AYY20_13965 [Photobacterium aquimaris]PSU26071.1 hypothetical protein CTM88_16575 [Photobacterium aquimaris]PSW02191.1 hypothetical protein CTM91_03675 [Photobacterium aquimaris]